MSSETIRLSTLVRGFELAIARINSGLLLRSNRKNVPDLLSLNLVGQVYEVDQIAVP